MHRSAEHVASELRALGVSGEVRELPEPGADRGYSCGAAWLPGAALEPYEVVWAAAGHAHAVFPTSFAELVRNTGGTPVDVG